MRLLLLALAAGLAAPCALAAQEQSSPAVPPVLTLVEAVAIARQNNPGYRTAMNARRNASAQVRAAYGAFMPNVNTSFSGDFREGRQQFFGGVGFGSTNDQLNSSGNINANMQLSMASLNDLRAQRSNADAVESEISAAEQQLRANVTTQFLAVLQAEARSVLQDTLLATTRAQLQLAEARLTVGSGTQLDVQRAQVANGQQRVAALNATNQAEIEKLRLFQLMGIEGSAGTRLSADLPLELPEISIDQLLDQARRANPTLEASRERELAARRGVSAARSQYIPTLSLNAGVSGFTQRFTDVNALIEAQSSGVVGQRASCVRTEEVRDALGLPNNLAQCALIDFGPGQEALIRDEQSRYPFDFTRNPYSVSATVSLPVFNGFRREQQIEAASVQRRNAENTRRQEELRVSADVTAAYLTLTAQRQAVELQEENAVTARTALSLAEERYRVGAINLVELIQARTDFERAETDRISAIYDFQRAFTSLEAAIGRPLR